MEGKGKGRKTHSKGKNTKTNQECEDMYDNSIVS